MLVIDVLIISFIPAISMFLPKILNM